MYLIVRRSYAEVAKKQKVIILGTGWAAFRMVKSLKDVYHIDVISPRNHFLFTPLLPSTTTGTLEFRSIVEPIRNSKIMDHANYFQASCTAIYPDQNKIKCKAEYSGEEFDLNYDKLVIAVGANNNSYNIPGVEENALYLKELADARKIRAKLLQCFEHAMVPSLSRDDRKRVLSIVVVGGGPTGVEFAGELSDFLWRDIPKAFPGIKANEVKVTLLEAAPKILSAFSSRLVDKAIENLKRQGVDVRTESPVKAVHPTYVELTSGLIIPYGALIWSTGVGPRPLIEASNFPKKNHRLVVDDFLKVEGTDNIYAMGDCATHPDKPLPPTAQVAQQQGKYLADSFNKQAKQVAVPKFEYHFIGLMTYVGNWKSLIDTPSWKSSGFVSWIAWRGAYLTRLGSVQKKLMVPFDWFKSFVFGRDVTIF